MEEFDILNESTNDAPLKSTSPINDVFNKGAENNFSSSLDSMQSSSLDFEEIPLFDFKEPQISINVEVPKSEKETSSINTTNNTFTESSFNSEISNVFTDFSELTSKSISNLSEVIQNSYSNLFSVIEKTNTINESKLENSSNFNSSLTSIQNEVTSTLNETENAQLTSISEDINLMTNTFLSELDTLNQNSSKSENSNMFNINEFISSEPINTLIEKVNTTSSELLEVSRNQDTLKDIVSLNSASVSNTEVAKSSSEVVQANLPAQIETEVSKQLAIEKSIEPIQEIEKNTIIEQRPVNIDVSGMENRLSRIEKILMSPLEVKIVN